MTTMSKPRAKPAPRPRPLPSAVAADSAANSRPVLYPDLTVNGVLIPLDKMRLSAAVLKKLLGWQLEEDYKAWCKAESERDDAKQVYDAVALAKLATGASAGFGEEYLLLDSNGKKVRCTNNLDNRPPDATTWEKYTQDVLNREWAGPSSFPGETVNGETIIIGRTGKVESGQHRGVAGVLAAERWAKNPKGYPQWTEEPFLESLVVFGVSENPSIVCTLDRVRPRTLADTIYTSEVFKTRTDGAETSQRERKELSRMLDAAVDLLWKRTAAGGDNEPDKKYQTHSASFDFLDRHESIKRFVKHLFEANSDRKISLLQLSAGQCAACCYLMGSSATDVDQYLGKRDEKTLDWSLMDKAEEFWTLLADGGDRSFKVLQQALGELKLIDEGLGGRLQEKLAVLAAAWLKFANDEEIKPADLELAYGIDKNKNPVLLDPPTFGGIDQGHEPVVPERVTPKEAEAAKKKASEKKTAAAMNAAAGKNKAGAGGSATETLTALKKDHPELLLLFRGDTGDYNAYGEDAKALALEMSMTLRKGPGGVELVALPQSAFESAVRQMMDRGQKVGVVAFTDGVAEVTEVKPRSTPKPAPAAAKPVAPTKPTAPKPVGNGKPSGPKRPGGVPKLRGGTGS